MARAHPRAAWLSPLVVAGGFLRGCIVTDRRNAPELGLEIDGKLVARARAGLPVDPRLPNGAARPAGKASGFLFPLPEAFLKGMPHDLVVRVVDAGRRRPAQARLRYQHGDRYGVVTRDDGHFAGWVAFRRMPEALPELVVSNAAGEICKTVKLIPLPAHDTPRMPYAASFRIPAPSISAPAPHFFCADVELQGSPCVAPRKPVGLLESVDADALRGWAFDISQPASPVELVLRVDGQSVLHFRPNIRRLELARHLKLPEQTFGIAGFQLTPPEILFDGAEHRIDIEFAADGIALRGSGRQVQFPRPYLAWPQVAPAPLPPAARRPLRLPPSPSVSVIVLNRNGESPLAALLESWEQHNRLRGVEWIVVDHASTDGSLALLERWRTRVALRIIALPANDSFSASCNRAAAAARGNYLLFLNNDIVWLQDALTAMRDTLACDKGIGAVGLKLLKAADDGNLLAQPQVQHLGIRIKLSGAAYSPYEASQHGMEAEHGTQTVPAVTAAAMLCRKADFIEAGRFDADYFYGFEDVEFCLRLRTRLGKRIVCRNDLAALHRHGHTRLSGRATDIFERQLNNADVLQRHAGLWLKRAYWQSLLAADGELTVDRLTIGFVVDGHPSGAGNTPLLARSVALARRILLQHPAAQPVFLDPARGWFDVRGIHILVVGHPEYDIRALKHGRADLLTLAWIHERPDYWARMPWWHDFDAYLASTPNLARQLAFETTGGNTGRTACPTAKIARSTPAAPLGRMLDRSAPPLRVAIFAPVSPEGRGRNPLVRQAQRFRRALRAEGAVAWLVMQEDRNNPTRLADVRVILHSGKPPAGIDLKAAPGCLNVLWHTPRRIKSVAAGFLCVTTMPAARWLRRQLENHLGRTFRTS